MNANVANRTKKSVIEYIATDALQPFKQNARLHPRKQIKQLTESIRAFGFTAPILIGDELNIIAGHGRVLAAKELGLAEVPAIRLSHLTPEQQRLYVLADNKLALNSIWDVDLLAGEFKALTELGLDLDLAGFSPPEIDFAFDAAREKLDEAVGREDALPEMGAVALTVRGDIWRLGPHKLICGDARDPSIFEALLGDERADLVFTDPPYNVKIDGNVTGLGRVRHRDFAMASGEMSSEEFTAFLRMSLKQMACWCKDGAILYVCMDWRHVRHLQQAGEDIGLEYKKLCVWNKTNAGMGSFYRSKHELVFVFKAGSAPHANNFSLGETGRLRSNVWDYAGVNVPGKSRTEALSMHPTVKPVALVADAIRDCSKRGDIVLDAFGGSGTTLIAAEICGRHARLIEIDPLYCDTIVRRWERFTGQRAIHASSGMTHEQRFEACRGAPPPLPADFSSICKRRVRRRSHGRAT